MYIRFISYSRDAAARTMTGIFQTGLDAWYDRPDLVGLWQLSEIHREFDWFNEHLDIPDRLWYRPYRRGERSGVCWFKSTASEHISRARYLAWLLADIGIATRVLRARRLHNILWQDQHQIVAIAEGGR